MTKLVFLLSLLVVNSALSQIENYSKVPVTRIKYYQDFICFLGDNGKTRMDVFIQVPYTGVQFIKTGQGFEASYSITISVYDEDQENLITEKIWNEKITAYSFEQTVARDNFNLSHRSFELPKGKYFIKTLMLDKDSKDENTSDNTFTVKDLKNTPSISDVMLIKERTVVEGNSKIIPNISRNVYADKNGLPIFFEVYCDSSETLNIDYKVISENDETEYEKSEKTDLKSGNNQIFYTIDSVSLNLGKFQINVSINNLDGEVLGSSIKSFVSRWSGVPETISNLDKAVDQLVYIANKEEIDNINNAKEKSEKTKRFVEFWKSKDPNPDDEYNPVFNEYYNRVAYANANFSTYSLEGWRSDRGMVLIILGVPDNIDRHPFEYYAKPYEVWQYYDLNHSFLFVDETGFGDYRLSPDTPLYGDLYRFRY